MYTQAVLIEEQRIQKREQTLYIAAWVLAALAVATMVILRWRYPAIITACLAGCVLVYVWDARIAPRRRYCRFLQELLSGRKHELTAVFLSAEDARRDGLDFTRWTMATDEGDIIAYADARLSWQQPRPGQTLRLSMYGSYIFEDLDKENGGKS